MKTCGDFGGTRADGEPCNKPSTDGPCWQHVDGAEVPGRPAVEFDVDTVRRLAGYGLTQDQIADFHGCTDRTLINHLKRDDALLSAYKEGKGRALHRATQKLHELIEQGDRAAIFFYLKTQGGWSETSNVDVTSGGEPLAQRDVEITLVKPDEDADDG